ncbi:MAG: Sua5/YciO/YrdC/YwlC family protein [Gemmatimonadota bacterium]|nr:Sua5/YciO/YrdC/YwlC family protein [Gemmatimonadota bacterium]
MASFVDLGRIASRADRIAAAAEGLRDGALLAHPTASVYGIGGRAGTDAETAALKGGGPDRRILRLVPRREDVDRLFPDVGWTPEGERLAGAFWPGPLTLVLPDGTPHGIAVRVESHPLTRAVLAAWGDALGSTSLNRSGEAPARTEAEAREVLRRLPEPAVPLFLLPGGDLPGGPPSSLVSLCGGVRLLREGAIPGHRIAAVLEGSDER